MIRFLFRLLALASLALAVIIAVMDATRSVASSAVEVTALGYLWLEYLPDSFAAVRQALQSNSLGLLWDYGIAMLLRSPAFIVFGAFAFLFYAIGHRPRRHPRFAAGH